MISICIIYSSQGITIAYSSSDTPIAASLPPPICTIDIPATPYLSSTYNANIEDNTSTIFDICIYIISN